MFHMKVQIISTGLSSFVVLMPWATIYNVNSQKSASKLLTASVRVSVSAYVCVSVCVRVCVLLCSTFFTVDALEQTLDGHWSSALDGPAHRQQLCHWALVSTHHLTWRSEHQTGGLLFLLADILEKKKYQVCFCQILESQIFQYQSIDWFVAMKSGCFLQLTTLWLGRYSEAFGAIAYRLVSFLIVRNFAQLKLSFNLFFSRREVKALAAFPGQTDPESQEPNHSNKVLIWKGKKSLNFHQTEEETPWQNLICLPVFPFQRHSTQYATSQTTWTTSLCHRLVSLSAREGRDDAMLAGRRVQ